MKSKIIFFIGTLIVVFACNSDDNSNNQQLINGEYVGAFERSGNISNVELNFYNGSFIGESEIEKFPAICNGSYFISSNSINFYNDCIWTAEFDWSLILNEEWFYEMNGNTLVLTKSNADKYILTKQ